MPPGPRAVLQPCAPQRPRCLQMLPSSQLIMDIYDEEKVCPESTAGIFSSITFSWLNPLLQRGYKHALELKDLWQAAPCDRVENLQKQFSRHWREQLEAPSGAACPPVTCAAPLNTPALPPPGSQGLQSRAGGTACASAGAGLDQMMRHRE